MRPTLLRLHRYAGLATALFLVVAGLTGAVIAFHHELDRLLNPGVITVDREGGGPALPPSRLVAAAEGAFPRARVSFVVLPRAEDEAARVFLAPRVDPATSEPFALDVDQVFVHPDTAAVLGARKRGAPRFDRLHATQVLYYLHFQLLLEEPGMWLMGLVGLVWLFDCLIALALAWPRRRWRSIQEAFSVKWRARAARVTYDLHRAGGLWTWAVLAVIAFTGVSMNLHTEVFEPLLELVAPQSEEAYEALPVRDAVDEPMAMSVDEAVAMARSELRASATPGSVGSIWIGSSQGFYGVGFHTERDLMREHAGTWVFLDGERREVLGLRWPNGTTAGDAIHDWQFPLHSGKAFGLGGRIFVAVIGILVAMLSVTGVLIWWRKRSHGPRAAS